MRSNDPVPNNREGNDKMFKRVFRLRLFCKFALCIQIIVFLRRVLNDLTNYQPKKLLIVEEFTQKLTIADGL